MKIKKHLWGLLVLLALGACKEDEVSKEDENGGGAISINCDSFVTADYLELIDDLNEKSTAYSNDPTEANCKAYVASLNTYIDSWQAFIEKCLPDQYDAYKSYWETYETYLDDLDCAE